MAVSPKGATQDYNIHLGRDRAYNSRAKNIIYGGEEDKPATPQHVGKRSVAHRGSGAAAPFATYDQPEPVSQGATHVAKPKAKDGADKPNERQDFDPEVYRQAIAANYNNMQASKARAYQGNNVFGTN